MSRKRTRKTQQALATRAERALGPVGESVVGALDTVFQRVRDPRSKAEAVTLAMAQAARILAPHFYVSNPFADEAARRAIGNTLAGDDGERALPSIENTEVLVEVFFSAGAWLARSRGMPRAELTDKLDSWLREQGYE